MPGDRCGQAAGGWVARDRDRTSEMGWSPCSRSAERDSSTRSDDLSGGGEAFDVEVDHHREEEHDAEEGLEPVGVPAGVDDAEAGHAEDEGADGDADGVAVAAGEEGAADHGG